MWLVGSNCFLSDISSSHMTCFACGATAVEALRVKKPGDRRCRVSFAASLRSNRRTGSLGRLRKQAEADNKSRTARIRMQEQSYVAGNFGVLDPKLGTRIQVQPRVMKELPMVGEHPARERIRELKRSIPEKRYEFKAWFIQVMTFIAMPDYNAYAANHILKVLLEFADQSDLHKKYMTEFIQQSSFCEVYQQRMFKIWQGRVQHRHLANLINNAGLLKMRLSEAFLVKWYEVAMTHKDKKRIKLMPEHFDRFRAIPSFQHLQLSLVMRGFADLNIRPPNFFMQAWFEAFQREERFFVGATLGHVMWGLGTLEITPTSEFVESWCYAFEKQGRRGVSKGWFDIYSLSVSLWGFAKLGIKPSQSTITTWTNLMTEALLNQRDADAVTAHAIANAWWGMGVLKVSFPDALLRPYFYRFEAEDKAHLRADALSQILWSYGCIPPKITPDFVKHLAVWCSAFRREDVYVRQGFSATQLSKMAWAFGRVQIMMDDETLYAWYDAFDREQNHFTARELAIVLWMFGKLRIFPDAGFWKTWCERFAALGRSDGGDRPTFPDLANVLHALARLELVPSTAFLLTWNHHFQALKNDRMELDAVSWQKLEWACSRLNLPPLISDVKDPSQSDA
ncbi:hypothetical protein FVE85_6712 [Porphyridium purpureum]|uniref:Tbc2 translation factor, chloroplastic n=1 Tax=Porphyridium purpureum TaxID=35688 RepID=A0A5J4Z8Y8_PORPP|nr:hypothetical protein FVE85_6712 [Porphyridium purpureum]|eukprot:POR1462..scf295_1